MSDRLIIGFAGFARCGKTTSAELTEAFVRANHPDITIHRMSMAGPIREALEVIGVTKEGTPDMYRDGAQSLGAIARKYDMDWWVKLASTRLEANEPGSLSIFDDIRYPNEVRMIQERGGRVVFIDAARRLDLTQAMYEHESERMAAEWMSGEFGGLKADAWITNNEDRAAFDPKIEAWVGDFLAE
ncbi:MAG: hypothetical protein ACYTGQ_04000 [Planctomycetota bacterium]